MKIMIFFLLLFTQVCWAIDLSASYIKLKSDNFSEASLKEVRNYKVLLIPGVLAQSFVSDSNNQIKMKFLFEEAFKEQTEILTKLKIEFEFVDLETENSPEVNAQIIANVIVDSPKKVLIYSHSKGGIDTLEALRQYPLLINKIRGWVSVQTPFWGAPVASGLSKNILIKDSSENIFKWMGGDAKGMSSLTINDRVKYMEDSEIVKLLSEINQKTKFINFATYKTNTFGIDTSMELFRNYTTKKAGRNDGVVPVRSAIMKEHGIDVDYIVEPEVDHLMTMTHYRLDSHNYDQKGHFLSLMQLILQ